MTMFSTSKLHRPLGILLFTLLSTVFLFSCEEENKDMMEEVGFDRSAMLESIADELIIPNFQTLQSSVNTLASAANTFATETNENNLITLREAWTQSVIDHQHCSAFGFGPASLLLGPYATILGAFPVDEAQVEQNINNANFDLANSFDSDVRGFYTVEYLIYGDGMGDGDVVASFDQARKDYLLLIVDELQTTFDDIVKLWTGDYRQEFIDSDGTAAGSSISLYYNEFVKDYENLKNFKVELPAGLTAGQESVDGTLVEAFYSGISLDLIEAHFQNSKNIWFGRSRSGNEIIGFEEYLESVVGGPQLIATTIETIRNIDNIIASIPEGRLSENIGAPEVEMLRNKLQTNTANFKSSLSSLLGISITFNSGDGD